MYIYIYIFVYLFIGVRIIGFIGLIDIIEHLYEHL